MKTNTLSGPNDVHDFVRESYSKIATGQQDGGCAQDRPSATAADKLGYSPEEMAALPEGADLGLGCGNPQAILRKPGFGDIRIRPKDASREFIRNGVPGSIAADCVVSATIEA